MTAPPPFPTRSLSDREFREGVITVSHSVRAEYNWDAGEAIGRYLDGLRAGRIMGRECRGCGRVLVPPRMFCEQCFRPTDRWVEVPGTGTVNTYSVCYVTWDLRRLTVPELPAVIDLRSGTSSATSSPTTSTSACRCRRSGSRRRSARDRSSTSPTGRPSRRPIR